MRVALRWVWIVCCLAACGERETSSGDRSAAAAPISGQYARGLGFASRPNLFLVMVDTLRADHLGCYGYDRPTSPTIDDLADRGIRFDRFYSVSPWTNPAIATLYTGRYPQAVLPPARHALAIRQALPKSVSTLPERLKSAGYRTLGFIDHPGIAPELGYARGFDEYHRLYLEGGFDMWTRTDPDFVYQTVAASFDALADGPDPDQPFFVYLHLVYPHRPYIPERKYAEVFGAGFRKIAESERAGIINMYDGEILQTDALIGRMIELLDRTGVLESTVIVVTSDHGEAFWEHGTAEHGRSFYDEEIRIPLIIVPPGGPGRGQPVVSRPASNVDLHATLLDLAGIAPALELQGSSLLRLVDPEAADSLPPTTWFFSESPHTSDITDAAVIATTGRKYVHRPDREPGQRELLFDLENDPDEATRLAGFGSNSMRDLRERLAEHRARNTALRSRNASQVIAPDDDTAQRLRALGYVD